MSHFFVGVILPEGYSDVKSVVETLLDPYNENKEMLPYKNYMSQKDVDRMADYYKLESTNFDALLENMENWIGSKGGHDDAGLFYWCTYNPNSKWDWYRVGGRWNGDIKEQYRGSKDGFNFDEEYNQEEENIILVKDVLKRILTEDKNLFFAIVTPDGKWHEKGSMGWFGISIDNKDNWNEEVIKILQQYPDNVIVGVDAHI